MNLGDLIDQQAASRRRPCSRSRAWRCASARAPPACSGAFLASEATLRLTGCGRYEQAERMATEGFA